MDTLGAQSFCYVTTVGRVTGRAHTIEIWYAMHESTVYLLSGGWDRSDWVRNLIRHPRVKVRIGDRVLSGLGRIVADSDEDRLARDLVYGKYQHGYGADLRGWRDSALPVAIDVAGIEAATHD